MPRELAPVESIFNWSANWGSTERPRKSFQVKYFVQAILVGWAIDPELALQFRQLPTTARWCGGAHLQPSPKWTLGSCGGSAAGNLWVTHRAAPSRRPLRVHAGDEDAGEGRMQLDRDRLSACILREGGRRRGGRPHGACGAAGGHHRRASCVRTRGRDSTAPLVRSARTAEWPTRTPPIVPEPLLRIPTDQHGARKDARTTPRDEFR